MCALTFVAIAGCTSGGTFSPTAGPHGAARRHAVTLDALRNAVLSWRIPPPLQSLHGLRLLYDLRPPLRPDLAVVHSIVRSNPRLDPFDAMVMASDAVFVAGRHHLDYGFFCATLLQESAFTPDAASSGGAVGIAQFTLDTARGSGVDPLDWRDAIRGSGALLGGYVAAYDGVYGDPYAAALAAYDAGPGTVAYYHGVPPYRETQDYVGYVYDRWARIIRNVTVSSARRQVP